MEVLCSWFGLDSGVFIHATLEGSVGHWLSVGGRSLPHAKDAKDAKGPGGQAANYGVRFHRFARPPRSIMTWLRRGTPLRTSRPLREVVASGSVDFAA